MVMANVPKAMNAPTKQRTLIVVCHAVLEGLLPITPSFPKADKGDEQTERSFMAIAKMHPLNIFCPEWRMEVLIAYVMLCRRVSKRRSCLYALKKQCLYYKGFVVV